MRRRAFLMLGTSAIAGCGGLGPGIGADAVIAQWVQKPVPDARMAAIEEMKAKGRFMQEVVNDPDLPAWHEQREKMALAVGDRVFDRTFDRVFDSMTIALATLGSRVNNMERTSGYITGSIPDLGPAKTNALHIEGLRQYAAAKGFNPKVAEPGGRSDYDLDVAGLSNLSTRLVAGLTISIVRQSKAQTKVKLRFDNVYYPRLISEYYTVVWAAVDKQMFLDQSLD